jgi:hypothetical protein
MHEVEHRSSLGFALAASVVTGISDIIEDHCDNVGVETGHQHPLKSALSVNSLPSVRLAL